MSEKYYPILTKILEPQQNQTFCLKEQCAWWEPSYNECVMMSIGKSLLYIRRGIKEQ